jgi:hypothetical protein
MIETDSPSSGRAVLVPKINIFNCFFPGLDIAWDALMIDRVMGRGIRENEKFQRLVAQIKHEI